MNLFIDIASWFFFSLGGLVLIVGALGMVRLPDFWSRIHAAGMIDTIGAEFMLVGMMLQSGLTLTTLKLLLIGLFIFIAGPTATHAIANAAWSAGEKPQGLARDDSARFAEGEKA
ncbi:MAG: monovalent cation/H(+) antiporter subunit G [Parvibaculum sp.]|uniref:monovalent cation/H(+) antiporter subunit G n=1 Tax=Parvibaculum sp. TaxID=2024848 RepID=UPI00284A2162|nr:monovalent cation/H(+) antiporter subunit G [Parvibaculum sp.]MDR3500432.1 monovalent cation/H(+) antiporter subunit G [Parvibaculum sp.]